MARDRDGFGDDLPAERGPRGDIPNYLVQSILVTLCCCLPLGIVAIIHAAKVNSLVERGDYAGAREASDQAKKWSMYGFVIGLALNLIVVVLQVLAGGLAGVGAAR